MRPAPTIVLAFILSLAGLAACAAQGIVAAQPPLPASHLVIETDGGAVEFTVELADDPA